MPTIDSYILSLIVETGVPGLVFFVGLLVLPVWYGLRNYLSDMSESGALAGALACSFIGFIMNRLVLSQKENHMLIFSLLAIVIVLNYEYARKRVPQRRDDKSLRNTYSPRVECFTRPSGRAKRKARRQLEPHPDRATASRLSSPSRLAAAAGAARSSREAVFRPLDPGKRPFAKT